MNEGLLIFGMMVVTFGVRYPVLAIVGRMDLPQRIRDGLSFVPVAVLTAITVPVMVMRDDQAVFTPDNAYLYVGIIAVLIAWRTKNLLATIGLGMLIFLAWQVVFG